MNHPNLLYTRLHFSPDERLPHKLLIPFSRLAAGLGPRLGHLVERVEVVRVLACLPHKLPSRPVEAPGSPVALALAVLALMDQPLRHAGHAKTATLHSRDQGAAIRLNGVDGNLDAGRGELGGAVQRRHVDLVTEPLESLQNVERLPVVGRRLGLEVAHATGRERVLNRVVDVVRHLGETKVEGGRIGRDGVLEKMLESWLDWLVWVLFFGVEVVGQPDFLLSYVWSAPSHPSFFAYPRR